MPKKQRKPRTRTRPGEMPRMLRTPKGRPYIYVSGKKLYLSGEYGSVEAEQDRVRKWLEFGGDQARPNRSLPITVAILADRFLDWAKLKYVKHGRSTGSYERFCIAVGPLLELYGATPVTEFRQRHLKAVRQKYVEAGLCRKIVNERTGLIKRIFKWGADRELLPSEVKAAVYDVINLAADETTAVDYAPIPPVDFEAVQKILPYCHPILADMILVQLYSGMRPQDVCNMRLCDIEMSGDVWEYTPWEHKTEHKVKYRLIRWLGPRAQEVLVPHDVFVVFRYINHASPLFLRKSLAVFSAVASVALATRSIGPDCSDCVAKALNVPAEVPLTLRDIAPRTVPSGVLTSRPALPTLPSSSWKDFKAAFVSSPSSRLNSAESPIR